jgi:ABC-type nickel/cobalt efflux system permease component RcnA
MIRFVTTVALLGVAPTFPAAHPITKDTHDRTIVVRFLRSDIPNRLRLKIEFRLEVDEATVTFNDMKTFSDVVNPLDFRGRPLDYYAEFAKIYGQIYADRLNILVNKKAIEALRVVSHKERLEDEDGTKLGHLRCDFVFETSFDLTPGQTTTFRFHEQNYYFDAGKIVLNLVNESGAAIESKIVPDETLLERAAKNPRPGDEAAVREILVTFAPVPMPKKDVSPTNPTTTPTPIETSQPTVPPPAEPRKADTHGDRFSLLRLILHSDYGFFLTMLFAFVFGAAHALTPGHGKTLVAAYLVGERGTVWHALYLGLVTTLTHTGVVIVIAIILALLSEEAQQAFKYWIENGLGLAVALMIVCMGFWLLLQRISGRADHIHLDGGHHHQHGSTAPTDTRGFSWWGLTVLGVTGGIIPCWDAVGVLGMAVSADAMWLILPAVLVFSAGLAAVLVAIGILVVQMPRIFKGSGESRFFRALPTVSAIAVILVGLWLCYEWSRAA